MDPKQLSGQELAYFGDAVIELLTRKTLLEKGLRNVGELNRAALGYVQATAQSRALDNIYPLLTEEELLVFKRGRNNHVGAIPKSASAIEYRRATGLEALFAYLWLSGDTARAESLFRIAYPDSTEESK